ncbi:MAG TPA: hypothetical protein ENH29_04575, partial [Bacteroidetes bacterium]|nr:hypothetical protein [Bacteroidota bacterium]
MIKKIIIFYFIFLFSVSIISTLSAQTGDAGQPGEFLRYGVGARALGMGHAFTALANDASAVYYNPAGLMGVERKEFTTMYSNLFYDSRYTYMAVALPRTFTGNSNALGFGWVNLTMANFDGRDIGNNQTGNFDIYQQAFMLSGAREWVGTWGILNYGVNLKLINQGFPGYQAEQGWGFGADVGATFKPINAPLFKIFALRFLMPLQLGVSLQNLLPPRVGVGENKKDPYPFIFRWGAGYGLHVKDWHVQLLYDQEKYSGRSIGHYAGLETNLPFLPYTESYAPKFRFGYNSRTKRPGFGAGFKFGFAGNANIRLDFAYSLKPQDELKND